MDGYGWDSDDADLRNRGYHPRALPTDRNQALSAQRQLSQGKVQADAGFRSLDCGNISWAGH